MVGKFTIIPKGKSPVYAKSGDILYIPSNEEYVSQWAGEYCRHCTIGFVLNDRDGKELKFANTTCIICHDENGFYKEKFVEMLNIHNTPSPGYKFRARSRFLELLYIMMNDTLESKHRAIIKGITHLENHYLEDVSVDVLAKMCNMSPSCFRRMFKEYSPCPPVQYRNTLRIKKAAELLKCGEHNVQSAAEAVNIPDVYYFSKLFKKVMGKSPMEYKKS